MDYFKNKTVLITGGGKASLTDGTAGSIGYGIAIAYAKEGANLVLTGRNLSKLTAAKEELESKYGIRVLALQADISAVQTMPRLPRRLWKKQWLNLAGSMC